MLKKMAQKVGNNSLHYLHKSWGYFLLLSLFLFRAYPSFAAGPLDGIFEGSICKLMDILTFVLTAVLPFVVVAALMFRAIKAIASGQVKPFFINTGISILLVVLIFRIELIIGFISGEDDFQLYSC